MNAEKIIDGLRHCDESAGLCIGCPLDMDFKDDKYCNIRLEAADLIESLLKQLANEQDSIACRNTICNGNREGMYRKCAELEELLVAIAGQKTLQEAFIKSQRREMAAVEDLKMSNEKHGDCAYCKYMGETGRCLSIPNPYKICGKGADNRWQWRGPQDGE